MCKSSKFQCVCRCIYTSRPLYGGGSGVCVYFVYVYIVLWFGVSFGCLWSSFCSPWGDFGSLWLPWDAGGSLWGTLGSQGELLVILVENGRPFPSKFGAFAMPAHKNWPAGILPRIPRIPRIPPIGAKCDLARSSQPHFTRAGG